FLTQPCSKIPYKGSHGVLDATADLDELVRRLERHPYANIAMAYGAASRITVVDWDVRHLGEETHDGLRQRYGEWDVRVIIYRQGGWPELYESVPGIPSRANAAGPGGDVRNDGAYGMVPWSMHPSRSRRYTFDVDRDLRDHEPGPMPDWLRNLLLLG